MPNELPSGQIHLCTRWSLGFHIKEWVLFHTLLHSNQKNVTLCVVVHACCLCAWEGKVL